MPGWSTMPAGSVPSEKDFHVSEVEIMSFSAVEDCVDSVSVRGTLLLLECVCEMNVKVC